MYNGVAFGSETEPQAVLGVVELPDDGDGRRGKDRLAVGFVVEAHVAGHDGRPEGDAGRGQPVDRLREAPHLLGYLRVSEVQAVGQTERLRAHTNDVARAFRYCHGAAPKRIDLDMPPVAVRRYR